MLPRKSIKPVQRPGLRLSTPWKRPSNLPGQTPFHNFVKRKKSMLTLKENIDQEVECCSGIELLAPDYIKISNVSFHSLEVYQYLNRKEDACTEIINACEAGVAVLERLGNRQELEYLGDKVESMLGTVKLSIEKYITQNLDPTTENGLSEKILKIFEIENGQVKGMLNAGTTNLSSLSEQIEKFQSVLEKTLSDSIGKTINNDQSSINILLRQLREDVSSVRDAVISVKTTKEKSAPAIGSSFEDSCQIILEKFCNNHSLILEDLRAAAGPDKSKKGDYKISGNGILPFVLEMKVRGTALSVQSCLSEVEAACINRNCSIGILVGDEDTLPKSAGIYNEYHSGKCDQIIVEYSVLEIALKIALAKARVWATENGSMDGVDIQKLKEHLDQLRKMLEKFGKARSCCNAAKKHIEKIDTVVEELRDELEEHCQEMTDALVCKGGPEHEEPN